MYIQKEFNITIRRELLLYIRELVERDKRKGTPFVPYVHRRQRDSLKKLINDIFEEEKQKRKELEENG